MIAQAESSVVDFEGGYSPAVASPLQVAWRRKSLVLLGLVTSLGLGTLYFVKAAPVYSSAAQVLVVKKQPDAVPISTTDGRMAVMEDYLAPHTTIIRSPEVIRRAVEEWFTPAHLRVLPRAKAYGDRAGNIWPVDSTTWKRVNPRTT